MSSRFLISDLQQPSVEQINQIAGQIFWPLVALVVAFILAQLARRLVVRTLGKRTKFEPRVVSAAGQVVFYGIIGIALIGVLGGIGLAIIAFLIIIGFAVRDIVENLASGMLILATRPFVIGDWITVAGIEGTVKEIGFRATTIDNFDGQRVVIPNKQVTNNIITNNTAKTLLRTTLSLDLDAASDLVKAEQVILQSLKTINYIVSDPEPVVLVNSLSGRAVNLLVRLWTEQSLQYRVGTISDAMRAIKRALDENGINMYVDTQIYVHEGVEDGRVLKKDQVNVSEKAKS